MTRDEIVRELEELPLTKVQWDIFLKIVVSLDRFASISVPYLLLRYNIDLKTKDRLITSFLRLGWGYFSQGRLYISDVGREYFSSLKIQDTK
jgi:hypothetical protein